MTKKANLFLSGTEYHFLMVMSLIDEYYSGDEYENYVVLNGYRSNGIELNNLPANVKAFQINLSGRKQDMFTVIDLVNKHRITDLFVFHLYKPFEAYIVYKLKGQALVHLVEDGALFYHQMEKTGLKSRIRLTFSIYTELFRLGLFMFKPLFYRFHMWDSTDVDEICMTRPDLFIGRENLTKPVRKIHLFRSGSVLEKYFAYFKEPVPALDNAFIYISFKVYKPEDAVKEATIIRYLFERSGKEKLFIKLHPASRKFQIDTLKQQFGEVVVNNVPAELYMARASASDIYGVASTSLFYHNESCQYFSLKRVCQQLGLYAAWKNVQLPAHVQLIEDIKPFREILNESA